MYKTCVIIGGDDAIAKEFAAEAGLKTDQAELITSMAAEVAAKYNLASQYAPEAFLLLGLATWGFQVNSVFGKLHELAKLKAKGEK